MNTSRVILLSAFLLHIGIGCKPRKVPDAPDPIPSPPGDPNQPVPNPGSSDGQTIGPSADPIEPTAAGGGLESASYGAGLRIK
jgi:hypothetical protein